MGVTAMVVAAATAVAATGYSIAQSQSAMQASHGAQNKADAERAQLMKTLTPQQDAKAQATQAAQAAQQRKKDYANLGQSSTILTGPGGLGSSGQTGQKTLLGY